MIKKGGVHQKGALDLVDILQNVRTLKDFKKVGAIAVFIGLVRGESKKGNEVSKLELDAFDERADVVLEKICDDLSKQRGIIDVQIHHLLGEFSVGEELVYVVVASSHRNNLFSTLEKAVLRYKNETPIFKKEHIIEKKGEERSYWVEEGDVK